MSAWGKFLAKITLSGSMSLEFDDASGTHIAKVNTLEHTTVLHLAKALQDGIDAVITGSSTVTVSSTGQVTIEIPGIVSVDWAASSSELYEILGFAGTETPSSDVLTATNRHTYGWYPGVITYGATRGEGLAEDSGWWPEDMVARQVAGSGAARLIAPSRMAYRRRLAFGVLHRDEVLDDRDRGVICLADRWATLPIAWYPDRDDGTVGSYGTQGDPGAYDSDDDCDWYSVTIAAPPRVDAGSVSHPDYFRVTLELNGEPS